MKMRLLRWPSWSPAGTRKEADLCQSVYGKSDPVLEEMDLSVEQKAALEELKRRAAHKVPEAMSADFEMVKWLAARNFDVKDAEKMLLKSLEWRKEWRVDSLLEWNPPEVLIKYYPVGLSGYDKEGAPVWIIPYGGCDIRGLLHSCTKNDFIRRTIQVLEKSLENMRSRSEGLEIPIMRQTFIFDLENFSLWDFTWKPAMDVILHLVQAYEANYPEILKYAYVINAPKLFATAYALIRPFLHEVTINKIKIFGRSGWQEEILRGIPADQLPVHWGGTASDPDGNTKCPSKICLGGEVPKSYYFKNKKDEKANEGLRVHLKSLILPKTGKEVFELEVQHPGTELRWEFQSDDFDVGFGISRFLPSGEEEILLPSQRVNSHLVPEEGSLICTDPGTYKITFDNEFSYIRSKKLYYNLQLFPPTEHTKF